MKCEVKKEVDGNKTLTEYETGIVDGHNAFRRSMSDMSKASVCLHGLEDGEYTFVNSDTGENIVLDKNSLENDGFEIKLPEKRSSAVFMYERS